MSDGEGYWLIPPEIYDRLNAIYHFDFDPCPNPRPDGYDGLTVPWGQSTWVNPLFQKAWTKWGRKAIAEYQQGKTVVMILPMSAIQLEMLRAGAQLQPLGWVNWLHTDRSGRSQKGSYPNVLWIFDPKKRTLDGGA